METFFVVFSLCFLWTRSRSIFRFIYVTRPQNMAQLSCWADEVSSGLRSSTLWASDYEGRGLDFEFNYKPVSLCLRLSVYCCLLVSRPILSYIFKQFTQAFADVTSLIDTLTTTCWNHWCIGLLRYCTKDTPINPVIKSKTDLQSDKERAGGIRRDRYRQR